MKPAPVVFRGRESRSYGLGGPTAFRGRGQMGDFSTPRPGVYQDQMTIRGVKREINAPYRPNTFNKKQKLTKPFVPFIKKPEKEIEDHLEGSYHQESLENIRKDANLDEVVIRFLHGENPFEITEDGAQNNDAELNHPTDDQAAAETVTEMN
ncbi:DBIRD complex subunit ZNF326 [Acipenser ruthenus]|uniref:DBIRD complex subunit ZNF326 n=1 Tax=Acipenser ruthenus TaxID=7906 RepID=A0A444TYC2_ACIRT|nr:DBIRD complex subunit ZNF326 [Acipenser ruthenus]